VASVSNIRPFLLAEEGGLSRKTSDKASANPAPWVYNGLTGWHTNKGVTYTTFSSLAAKLGYANTADNFFKMPDSIWDKIFKNDYWNAWYLDQLNSQAIADLLADFSFNSGPGGSFNSIQKYLDTKGIHVANRMQAVAALNKIALLNEQTIFLELIAHREAFYRSLSDFSLNGKGWLSRLGKLKAFGLETILKKKLK
jgi:lysozyme family protein